MLLLIDNYDSFSYNLFQYISERGEQVRVVRNDKITIDEIEKNRWEIAKKFARENKAVTVLKGAQTTIADPEGNLFINIVGNAGMASGGVGDVLTGIIGSLVGQRLSPLDAAKLGVFLHGTAGDLAAEKIGEPSLIASDLIEALPEAIKTLQNRR